jgi:hypothetical protein
MDSRIHVLGRIKAVTPSLSKLVGAVPPETRFAMESLPSEIIEKLVVHFFINHVDPLSTKPEDPDGWKVDTDEGNDGPEVSYGMETMIKIAKAMFQVNTGVNLKIQEIFKDDRIYNSINNSMGFYNKEGEFAKLPPNPSRRATTPKQWLEYCGDKYRTLAIYCRPVQFWDAGDPDLAELFYPPLGEDVWLIDVLRGLLNKYAYERVAEELEDSLNVYFDDLREEIDQVTPSDEAENFHLVSFMLGAWGDQSKFVKLLEDDQSLKFLKDSMETKPSELPSWLQGLDMWAYNIIYATRDLIEILRKNSFEKFDSGEHTEGDQKVEVGNTEVGLLIKEMFFALTYANQFGSTGFDEYVSTWHAKETQVDDYNIPRTWIFCRDLLVKWLELPILSDYIFQEGDIDQLSLGDYFHGCGYFRKRKEGDGYNVKTRGTLPAYD